MLALEIQRLRMFMSEMNPHIRFHIHTVTVMNFTRTCTRLTGPPLSHSSSLPGILFCFLLRLGCALERPLEGQSNDLKLFHERVVGQCHDLNSLLTTLHAPIQATTRTFESG